MAWLPKNCVVVPVDFSAGSLAAIDTALEMVDGPSRVHLIHVLPELQVNDPGVVWDTIHDDERKQHAEDALRGKVDGGKYTGINIHVRIGSPGREITECAEQLGCQLIVMPSHGRTGLSRMLLGSVADRVVRLARCPVLILRH